MNWFYPYYHRRMRVTIRRPTLPCLLGLVQLSRGIFRNPSTGRRFRFNQRRQLEEIKL